MRIIYLLSFTILLSSACISVYSLPPSARVPNTEEVKNAIVTAVSSSSLYPLVPIGGEIIIDNIRFKEDTLKGTKGEVTFVAAELSHPPHFKTFGRFLIAKAYGTKPLQATLMFCGHSQISGRLYLSMASQIISFVKLNKLKTTTLIEINPATPHATHQLQCNVYGYDPHNRFTQLILDIWLKDDDLGGTHFNITQRR